MGIAVKEVTMFGVIEAICGVVSTEGSIAEDVSLSIKHSRKPAVPSLFTLVLRERGKGKERVFQEDGRVRTTPIGLHVILSHGLSS